MKTKIIPLLFVAVALFSISGAQADPPQFKVLMISTTNGWHHDAISEAVPAIRGLAAKHHFEVVWEENIDRMFHIHPPIQTGRIEVIDRNFPGVERMPDKFWVTDEFYQFGEELTEGLNYIFSVDENTYDPVVEWPDDGKSGEGMGDFHPIAWNHEFDGGRSFFTGLGHLPAVYDDDLFLNHLYGGIYWAATGKGINSAENP